MSKLKLNLEQLRNRARELLRAVQAGDARALARVAKALPHAAAGDFKLAQAQTVIARENRFASWPKLKETADKDAAKRRNRTARAELIAATADAIIAKARAGDSAGMVAVWPLGKTAGAEVVARISADAAALELVIDGYIAGLSHSNPKVRHESAHALDAYGHPRAVAPLLALSHDPVPRVRWMAMHALACDACKAARPEAAGAFERACDMALRDPSVQVRRQTTFAVALFGGAAAVPVLESIAKDDADETVRRYAASALKRLRAA